MKILIATGLYTPDIGGPATYTRFLERVLPARGFSLTVVSFGEVRHLPKIIRHLAYLWKLLRAGWEVDVIYALDTVSVGLPATIASIILRTPLYVRVPGDYAWEQGQQRFGVTSTLDEFQHECTRHSKEVRALVFIQAWVVHHATRVVVPSEYMRSLVMGWEIASEKIIRVYSALSPIILSETRESLRQKYNYTGVVVTTAARLVPWKGIVGLCEAVLAQRGQGMNVSLEIIGDGVLRDALEVFIKKHNAYTYITLRGSVGKQELWERVKASDVFVLNTAYEGLSHQLLEVMNIGTPIITTPVGGNVELITHGKEGLLVAHNDVQAIGEAITRLTNDTLLCEHITRAARTKVGQFREVVIAEEVVRLFS
ncbi:glycosyltransferase family 4 protein [Candidatus Kaiserbacteria bacterium]|nr:MAG: glycosyltransferase family 4 protein [Candidatus Kaiserbacteria bacterium]